MLQCKDEPTELLKNSSIGKGAPGITWGQWVNGLYSSERCPRILNETLKRFYLGRKKGNREKLLGTQPSHCIQPWCSMFKRNECRLRYFDTNLRGFDTRQVFLAMVAWNVRWRMKLNITVQFQRRLQHVAWSMLLDWSRGQPCAFQSGFTIPRKKEDEEEEENEGSQLYSIARALRGVWKYNRDVPKAHHELRACVELS